MVAMKKATNFISSVVSLFLYGLLVPALGARNMFLPPSPAQSPGDTQVFLPGPAVAPTPTTGSAPSLCVDKVHPLGYVCQDHTVITKDGYYVKMARIPFSLTETAQSQSALKPKPAVLLQHGVVCDGAMFLLLGRESLAIYLVENGFDVWIANSRGTKYSRGHKSLNPNMREFWDWSWDDLAEKELPAMVDYMRMVIRQDKVHYIGHSMGTLMVLGALAERAPVVDSLASAVLLCPIGHLNHITSPLAVFGANLFLGEARYLVGRPQFNVFERPIAALFELACGLPGVDCSNFLNGFTGQNCCIRPDTVTEYLAVEPQPTSSRVMVHLSQNIRTGVISKFDFKNAKMNREKYGTTEAPVFNMTNIPPTLPIYVAYGGLDSLADYVDVELLLGELKNHDPTKLVTRFTLEYAHMDFLMAFDARAIVYEPLLPFLKIYS